MSSSTKSEIKSEIKAKGHEIEGKANELSGKAKGMMSEAEGKAKGLMNSADGKVSSVRGCVVSLWNPGEVGNAVRVVRVDATDA